MLFILKGCAAVSSAPRGKEMNSQDLVEQMTVAELKAAIDSNQELVLLDVREPHELEICKLPFTVHIPMGELRFHLEDLEKYKNSEIIVYCRSGRRSNLAADFLQECGFKVKNLKGGVLAWSDEIDSSFRKY